MKRMLIKLEIKFINLYQMHFTIIEQYLIQEYTTAQIKFILLRGLGRTVVRNKRPNTTLTIKMTLLKNEPRKLIK